MLLTLCNQRAAGQRVAECHLAFCPALARVPDFEVDPVSGPDAQLEVTHLVPWGSRIEIRLSRPMEVTSVVGVAYQFEALRDPAASVALPRHTIYTTLSIDKPFWKAPR